MPAIGGTPERQAIEASVGTKTLAAHSRRTTRRFLRPRLDLGRPQSVIVDVLERDGHDLGGAIDRHMAEELQPEARRQVVALAVAASLLENRSWAEGVVELLRTPGAGVDRTRDEFPEWLEILKHGRIGVVV